MSCTIDIAEHVPPSFRPTIDEILLYASNFRPDREHITPPGHLLELAAVVMGTKPACWIDERRGDALQEMLVCLALTKRLAVCRVERPQDRTIVAGSMHCVGEIVRLIQQPSLSTEDHGLLGTLLGYPWRAVSDFVHAQRLGQYIYYFDNPALCYLRPIRLA